MGCLLLLLNAYQSIHPPTMILQFDEQHMHCFGQDVHIHTLYSQYNERKK